MVEMGKCVQRLIALLFDNSDPLQLFLFSKLDMKDGFWRLAVSNEDAWNFCFILLQTTLVINTGDSLIVVPNYLQMGWFESPSFLCAASEMAHDTISSLLQEVHLQLPIFEDKMQEPTDTLAYSTLNATALVVNLTEFFIYDFISATNNTNW